jgi:hypothetical protein
VPRKDCPSAILVFNAVELVSQIVPQDDLVAGALGVAQINQARVAIGITRKRSELHDSPRLSHIPTLRAASTLYKMPTGVGNRIPRSVGRRQAQPQDLPSAETSPISSP